MGVTFAQGIINGPLMSRQITFLVDTGATWLSLQPQAITELGLDVVPGHQAEIITPAGLLHSPFYRVNGTLQGVPFAAYAVETRGPYHLVGYELLQNLGFVVDPASERIVLRTEWPDNAP